MQRFPLLFWAFFFLIGCALVMHPHWVYAFPTIGLFYLTKRKLQGIIFLIAGYIYTFVSLGIFFPKEKELEGRGIFELKQIQPISSPFQRSFALKGRFLCFETENTHIFYLPCMIIQKKIPTSGSCFIVEGKISKGIFKPKKEIPWKEVHTPFSLTRWRYTCKQTIRKFFHKNTFDVSVGNFFASLVTGDIDTHFLSMEFQKVGLGHILVISGFHFALIAGALGKILRLCFCEKYAYSLLLLLLTAYYLFLGFSASVLRAFIMISFFILGKFLRKNIEVCNLLGIALFIELLCDPYVITQVGFQLSFLAIFGIFIFYHPMHKIIKKFSPERTWNEIKEMDRLDQHGYLFLSFIRKATALHCAVYLTTIPLVLFHFHSFPLLSLPYNLLFPPFLGISMLLIPFGACLPPIRILHTKFTAFFLQMIENPPERFHYQIFIENIPYSLLILLLSLVGFFGLTKRESGG